jgi:hypothetical protein
MFSELALFGIIMNINDVRPILKGIKSVDSEVTNGWAIRKEVLRNAVDRQAAVEAATEPDSSSATAAKSATNPLASLFGTVKHALFGRGLQTSPAADQPALSRSTNSNLIDVIEQAAREEFASFQKEQVEAVKQMEEFRRKQEEEQQAQIQAMKDQGVS